MIEIPRYVYKKFIIALSLLLGAGSLHPALRAQELREFTLSEHQTEVSAFVDDRGSTLRASTPMPLVAFEVNGHPFTAADARSEEHTSELQSLMRISYAVFCLKKTNTPHIYT